ncbi:sulfotransferase domain-containing protein [Alteraurantiacibacter aquimixticola]|nr:sulfotransferase domain-containing protein [Alteraurantiacibacter aquimixticola]
MQVEPRDRFLFSYPRSGNTWLRHVVHHVTHGGNVDAMDALEDAQPTIDALEFGERLARMGDGPRFFKSHLPAAPYFLEGKVVYIVRDGRDVTLSYYDYFRHIHSYPGSFDEFMKKATTGWMRYGSWRDNVGSWLKYRDHPNMLLIRYEDMRREPVATAASVFAFCELEVSDEDIRAAVDASSVEKVHATLRSWNGAQGTQFSGGASGGGKKGWRSRMTEEQNRIFVDHAGDLLVSLGYPTE